MKNKNVLLYIAIGIVVLFTAVYFVVANKISYAFAAEEETMLLDGKLNSLSMMAQLYGENNLDLFNEDDTIYVTVNELVEKGYVLADDDKGNVKDPTSDVKVLNELKIRITLKDGEIATKILV